VVSRRPLALLIAALLAVSSGITACGGTQISADEVSGAPPELTTPTQREGSADALAEPDDASSSDPSGTTGGQADSTDDTPQTSDEPVSGGSTPSTPGATATPQPQAEEPQTTATPSDPGGSEAPSQSGSNGGASPGTEEFEEFCRQNAGAC